MFNLSDSWLSDEGLAGYRSMAKCVEDEYNQFCVNSGCVNGTNTLSENIADNAGKLLLCRSKCVKFDRSNYLCMYLLE